jgi:hypothetical protein
MGQGMMMGMGGQQGAGGMQGMGGGAGMMGMMQMMRMMGAMDGAMQRGMVGHTEGRIAFLRAELKITDSQTPAWNAFAEAVRTNARKINEASSAAATAQTLLQRVAAQEVQLKARLEGLQGLRGALTALDATFSEEQKKVAEELLPGGAGMGMGMMAMRGGQN